MIVHVHPTSTTDPDPINYTRPLIVIQIGMCFERTQLITRQWKYLIGIAWEVIFWWGPDEFGAIGKWYILKLLLSWYTYIWNMDETHKICKLITGILRTILIIPNKVEGEVKSRSSWVVLLNYKSNIKPVNYNRINIEWLYPCVCKGLRMCRLSSLKSTLCDCLSSGAGTLHPLQNQ